ncbi:uncharacterized protein LOC129809139 [Phlebotomus papatasi]|uniref:uncharacterized protein LOC129809139 n=1 Tax=Phlebotomus papatasi TaxID=29031 RepID=UPI002483EC06|nr:uncharacterized protein LOC129809139 [Phlebotomus papatasi]
MRSGFEVVWGFPQCYGAIDECHIEIKVNDEDKVDYHNYKGWYLIVLLAAVDYRYRFTYVNIGSPGRNNDSHIFERSIIRRLHNEDETFQRFLKVIQGVQVPILLLGDSAFRLDRFLMKPYPHDNLTPKEKHFNYMLSRARRVTENAFGQLKNRFRRIGNGLELMLENDSIVIRVSCILHNILNEKNDYLNEEFDVASSEQLENREQPVHVIMRAPTGDGITVRNTIADYLWARDRRLDENNE